MTNTIGHLSDLHIGRDANTDARTALLAQSLAESGVDLLLLTGDVTHHGRRKELATFERLFDPVRSRLVVVPGNHDRLGDGVARALMPGSRVQVEPRRGVHLVRIDSTAAHNKRWLDCHGELTDRDVLDVVEAVDSAPDDVLVVLMLHHHLLPLPEDHFIEQLATFLGWPNATELDRGVDLVARVRGRCDLVLHGHRHHAGETVVAAGNGRGLRVLNAGSSPELGRIRLITHEAGRLVASRWSEAVLQQPSREPATSTERDPSAGSIGWQPC